MRMTDFNDNWLFDGRDTVRLPHNGRRIAVFLFR